MKNEDFRYACKCIIGECWAGDVSQPDGGPPAYCCGTGKKDAHWKSNPECPLSE